MFRISTTVVVAALLLGAMPAQAAPGKPAPPATATPLAVRIQDAVNRYQGTGARPALDELAALSDEAARNPKLDAGLAADLATIYAYSLARAQKPDDAIAAIVAAQAAYARAGYAAASKMGDLLLAQAAFEDLKGDTATAYATKSRALDIYLAAEGPDSPSVATVRAQLAFSLFAQGRLGNAITAYQDALPRLAGKPDLVRVYAMQMTNYAGALRLAGDLEQALAVSRVAVSTAREKLPAKHPALLFGLNTQGAILMDLGRYAEAEAVLREGLDLAVQIRGKTGLDTAGFTYRLAQVLQREGATEEAAALYPAALAALDGVNTGSNPDLPGLIRLEQARLSQDAGDPATAARQLQAGLDAIAGTGALGDTTRARLRTSLAEALLLQRDYAGGLVQVGLALDYYRSNMPDYAPDRVRAGMLQALLLSRSGQTAEALTAGQTVAAAMRAHLDRADDPRWEQANLASTYQLSFVRLADVALTAGQPDEAFAAAQMAAVSEVAATSQAIAARAATSDPAAADLARRLQDKQVTRLRLDRERSYASGKSDDEVKRLDQDIAALDTDIDGLAGQLAGAFPAYARLSHPQPVGQAQAQASLGSDEAVVLPLLSDDRLITLVLTHDALAWDSRPLDRATALTAILSLRSTVTKGLQSLDPDHAGFDRAPAWQLGGAIFTPAVRIALGRRRAVAILGSGPLMTVPFAALLTAAPRGADNDPHALRDSAWLIRTYALSVKPAFLAPALSATPARAAPAAFLGVGAPLLGDIGASSPDNSADQANLYQANLYRDDLKTDMADVAALRRLPALPKAADELNRMNAALNLTGSRLLLGADATEGRLRTTDLSSYSVIAFATHGLIGDAGPSLREPALVLTPPAQPKPDDDGLLTASDIAGLRLQARWVILSACNTGSGREAGAAGYSGLARAFMQAGAKSLLVSLWPVRDDIADRLSVDTVRRNARGASQAQALRASLLDLLTDPRVDGAANPAIWAPFSLVVR